MWLSIRGVISPNKCVTPELGKAKLWCHGAGNFENRKFYEILTLVTSEAIIFNEFSSLTRISLPAALVLHYYMTRKAVSCKSNTGTGVFVPNWHEKSFSYARGTYGRNSRNL